MIGRAADRFVTDQPGIRTLHSFSSGPHYEPDNVSFGPVVACDEHLVAPGAGFDWHPHRGVVIVSWVLAGTLAHEDDVGTRATLGPRELLVQSVGDGVRHREVNASADEPLRLVQTTLLLDLPRSVARPELPAHIADVGVDVVRSPCRVGPGHVFLASAGAHVEGIALGAGDSLRLDAEAQLSGASEALVLSFEP